MVLFSANATGKSSQNMAAFVFRLSILFFTLIVGYVGSSCNGETMYVEIESHVVLPCDISLDYLAICWYLQDPHGHPLSCIEGGKKTSRDGYGISDQGALIIDKFHEEHTGVYIIGIIDTGGNIHNMNITIDIKVSLESKPTIVDCSSSVHETCTDVDGEKRQATLVCIAGPAKPPVTISWSSYDGTHQLSVEKNHQNASTSLYTSISLLEYDANKYFFEYFTCDVTGEAAAQNTTTGIFKKGNKDIVADDQNTKFVISGDDLTLVCSEFETHPMGEWGIVYPNESFNFLWRKYPGYQAGSCRDGNDCEVDTDGSLHISDVTYVNEGHYVCAYSNSVTEGIRKIPVEVLVSPSPGTTVIGGCEEDSECERIVDNSGSIECSILGSRPPVTPDIIVSKTGVHIGVFLFEDERESLDGAVPGTFDSTHKVNYKIPECSGMVKVDCVPDDSKHQKKILKSSVTLITATSNCDERGGKPILVGFIVILILALIIGAVVFISKRYRVRRFISSGYKKTPQDEEVGSGTDNTSTKQEENEEETGAPLSEALFAWRHHVCACDSVYSVNFGPVTFPVTWTENIDIGQMLETFCNNHKVSDALPQLCQFLRSKCTSLKEEDAMAIVKYILNNLPPKWISPFLTDLAGNLQGSNVSSTNFMSLIGEAYPTEKIDIGEYVELTVILLQKHVISIENIMIYLKSFVDKDFCSKEEFADTILHYFRKGLISYERIIYDLFGETPVYKFALPYILQSLYQHCRKVKDTISFDLFEILILPWNTKKSKDKHVDPLDTEGKDPNKKIEAFRYYLVTSHLSSYNIGLIDHITTVSMIEKTEMPSQEFSKLLGEFVNSKDVNSVDIKTNLLVACISKKLISEELYIERLEKMLKREQLNFGGFKKIMHESMEEQLLSMRSFQTCINRSIEDGVGNEGEWIIFVKEMSKKNMIGKGVQRKLIKAVIDKHELKRDDVTTILSDSGMSKEQMNIFLAKLKFH